jgi:hypothetical protein
LDQRRGNNKSPPARSKNVIDEAEIQKDKELRENIDKEVKKAR